MKIINMIKGFIEYIKVERALKKELKEYGLARYLNEKCGSTALPHTPSDTHKEHEAEE